MASGRLPPLQSGSAVSCPNVTVYNTGALLSAAFHAVAAFLLPSGAAFYLSLCVPEYGPDGDVANVPVVSRDLADRRRAEEALRKSEERLHLALEAGHAGAWTWEPDSGAVTWSPESYELYGIDPGSGPLNHAAWERCLHPDDLQAANAVLRDAWTVAQTSIAPNSA